MWNKTSSFLKAFEEYFLLFSIYIMTTVSFLQVIYRYVLRYPQTSFEEIARYFMISLTFIGAGLAVKKTAHIRLDFLLVLLVKRPFAIRIIETANNILGIIFSAIMCGLGYGFLIYTIQAGQHSTGANIPMFLPKSTIFIGSVLMLIHYFRKLFNQVKSLGNPGHDRKTRVEGG